MTAPLDAALGYARLGIRVFPVWPAIPSRGGFICGCGRLRCDSPAKHPLSHAVRHGLNDASADELKVRSSFTNYPAANVGAVMGEIVAIDIDPRHGGEAFALGDLPRTWRATTGGGGEHIFFATDAAISNSRSKLAKGIDIRARGGFVVLPPSRHISGNVYRWHPCCAPHETPLAPLPSSIITALEQQPSTATSRDWSGFAASETAEGGRNNAIAQFAGHLLRRFVDPRVVLELLIAWNATHCRPPLSREEVVRTINSIAGIELRRRRRNER